MARAGRFRHRLTIQTSTLSDPSSTGERTRTWTDLATVWGEFREMRGRELEKAQQIVAEATIQVRLRFKSTFTSEMRVQHGTRLAYPKHVTDDVRQKETMALCTEQL